jgi:hypothetical protein
LVIEGTNHLSSEKYELEVTIMNSERAIHPLIAAAFALGIGVVVLIAHSLIRKQTTATIVIEDKRLSKKIENKSNQQIA